MSYACVAVAGAIFAWTLFDTGSRLWAGLAGPSTDASQASGPAQKTSVALNYDVGEIVNAHLFGQVASAPAPAVVEQAPETQLSLSLLGVIASANPGYARALIGVDQAQVKNYAMGEQIEGTDAKVHTVEDRKVIIERNGQYESLMMERILADNSRPGIMSTSPRPAPARQRPARRAATPAPSRERKPAKFPF